jgi:hypothetical protein
VKEKQDRVDLPGKELRGVNKKESLHFVVYHIPNFSQKDGETLSDFPM